LHNLGLQVRRKVVGNHEGFISVVWYSVSVYSRIIRNRLSRYYILGSNINRCRLYISNSRLIDYLRGIVMVVVIRYFGGIKLGTGGLVRAYGGVAAECLKNSTLVLVKSKVRLGMEVPFDLLGVVYHQLQSFQVEDIKQDYETGKYNISMVTFKVDFDRVESLEDAVKANCSREIVFYKS